MINIVFIGFNYKYAIIGFEGFESSRNYHCRRCTMLDAWVFELSSERPPNIQLRTHSLRRMILSKSIKASHGASHCWLIMANNG